MGGKIKPRKELPKAPTSEINKSNFGIATANPPVNQQSEYVLIDFTTHVHSAKNTVPAVLLVN